MKSKTKCIGILTSGGDCPGLNAAIRAVTKAAMANYGIHVIGILDGFRGLVENRTMVLDNAIVSGILAHGGTILGTSRDKPRKMQMGGSVMDMTQTAVRNARQLGIDCLVCLGGGGTQKNALELQKAGLNVMTLPKTIDNDIVGTDTTFGFDTAMAIATEAIDRLHTTASSHQRMIICEVMGHNAGWLALGAATASGADVVLLPEIPYDPEVISDFMRERRRSGKRFSIVALSEGAISKTEAKSARKKDPSETPKEPKLKGTQANLVQEPKASRLARQLQHLTGIEARVTSLGHVQRGGSPTAYDRLLCTHLGTKAAELLAQGAYNVMVAVRGDYCEPVSLEKIAGKKKTVPMDHPWIRSARQVGTSFGDR